jgi:hypothetical protein
MTGIAKSSPNLPATAGAATSVPAGEIQSALDGPAPATDEELLALARELDKIISQLEGADR